MRFETGAHAFPRAFADVDEAGVVDEDVEVAVCKGSGLGCVDNGLIVGYV